MKIFYVDLVCGPVSFAFREPAMSITAHRSFPDRVVQREAIGIAFGSIVYGTEGGKPGEVPYQEFGSTKDNGSDQNPKV
jgi:hypothetical protein